MDESEIAHECCTTEDKKDIDVSVILPVHNAGRWLDECLQSICNQEHQHLTLELSVFLDSCSDVSETIVERWIPSFRKCGFKVTFSKEDNGTPKGVGYAKNQAIRQSSGKYLCFQDADDIMMPGRILRQVDVAAKDPNVIVGCRFTRIPEGSTGRFTRWANTLTPTQLMTQIYTSNGPTVIMPTWVCHRGAFDRVGGFDEGGKGTPEDLIFFYRHIRLGGQIRRLDEELLVYRYHTDAATFGIDESTIWTLRVREIEERVLSKWSTFTIWNGGKQGRKFYRSLAPQNRAKVTSFCDVDAKKIGTDYTHEESPQIPKPKVPIVHFREATPPFIICVKMDLTGGVFEENLASLKLKEGEDYFHFN